MTPKDIAADLKAAFPGVKLLNYTTDTDTIDGRNGLGVEIEINGEPVRHAWTFRDTPDNWQLAKKAALQWLADQLEK